jgi:hypothetical protein
LDTRTGDESTSISSTAKRELLVRILEEKVRKWEGWSPLSYSQKTYWAREERAPGTAVCTEAFAVRMQGDLDVAFLESIFQELTVRHPCLRTIYAPLTGQPAQRFLDRQKPTVQAVDASAWSQEELRNQLSADAHRPFDLVNGPVYDVHLYKKSARESIILTKIHHLVIDLRSMTLVLEDFQALFLSRLAGLAPTLPPLAAHYRDFIRSQEEYLQGPAGERDWQYWKQQLAPPLSGLELPTDRPRPETPTYRGAVLRLQLDAELTKQLREVARKEQTTLFAVLLAGFQILMGRLSGQDDVVVGTRTSGRSRQEFMRIVGCFVNPVALRIDLSGGPDFRSVLRRARQTVQEALSHQEYPYVHLLSRLSPPVGSAPLCNAVLVLLQPHGFSSEYKRYETTDSFGIASQATSGGGIGIGSNFFEVFPVKLQTAFHDLELEMTEAGTALQGWLRYRLDLFDEVTVVRFVQSFKTVLNAMVVDPGRRITELSIRGLRPSRGVQIKRRSPKRSWLTRDGAQVACEPSGRGRVRANPISPHAGVGMTRLFAIERQERNAWGMTAIDRVCSTLVGVSGRSSPLSLVYTRSIQGGVSWRSHRWITPRIHPKNPLQLSLCTEHYPHLAVGGVVRSDFNQTRGYSTICGTRSHGLRGNEYHKHYQLNLTSYIQHIKVYICIDLKRLWETWNGFHKDGKP